MLQCGCRKWAHVQAQVYCSNATELFRKFQLENFSIELSPSPIKQNGIMSGVFVARKEFCCLNGKVHWLKKIWYWPEIEQQTWWIEIDSFGCGTSSIGFSMKIILEMNPVLMGPYCTFVYGYIIIIIIIWNLLLLERAEWRK